MHSVREVLRKDVPDCRPPHFLLSPLPDAAVTSIVLSERLGEGRIGSVWRVHFGRGTEEEPVRFDWVAKVIHRAHIASITRESLFYEFIFPSLPQLADLVPGYHGTYVSRDSEWYVVLLDYAGVAVEDYEYPSSPVHKQLARQVR